MSKPTRVLGIDPGFERLGVAVIDREGGKPASSSGREKLIFSDCWQTSAKKEFSARLLELGQKLEVAIKTYQPQLIAVEKLFFTNNQKTASQVSEVRGMILYVAAVAGVPTVEFTPLQVKMAICGYGKASKEQVMNMVPKLIKLETRPKYDDEFDAIAIALSASARFSY